MNYHDATVLERARERRKVGRMKGRRGKLLELKRGPRADVVSFEVLKSLLLGIYYVMT